MGPVFIGARLLPWVICILGFAGCVACKAQSVSQAEPSTQELLVELKQYESSFYGLSFSPSVETVGRNVPKGQIVEYVSRNGGVRCWEGTLPPNKGGVGREYAGKAVASKGWVFQVSRAMASGAKAGEAGMTVVFHSPNSTSALARDVSYGFIENRTFSEYALDSSLSVSSDTVFGIPVWVLNCDHPVGASVQFFFQHQPLQLIGLTWKRVEGDQFRLGPIFLKPRVMTSGQWVSATYGPIEYGDFFDRTLPISMPFSGNSSEPNSKVSGSHRFSNYNLLENDLSSKIEFPTFQLPEDGERVTSQGEEAIRYEVRDGELVKIVDSQAIASARRSRFFNSAFGSVWWYSIGAILVIIILVFLINRRAS